MIRAIVFDFDGLIIDTETLEYEVLQQIYKEYEVELLIETYAQNIGTNMGEFNPYTNLADLSKQDLDAQFIKTLHRERLHLVLPSLVLREGVMDYIHQAKQMNMKIALATSSNRKWIDEFFTRYDLHQYFDYICTSDDVTNVKPNPELYLRALSLLGVEGHEAIAFEDSHNGSLAAVAAGIHCVAVPNPVTQHFTFEHCSLILTSMAQFTLSEVIDRIGEK
ncbi:MAG: HAD family hydrolase [Candidatus Pristimantibacillus lignocellulolyticus]|uniref:HAD family hydrolase n=1 Tax=Candidatus Pristimantibacillus lignocellulolyticus TaxID=2994561 RepID=A0A9J6ZGH7_9BACL|nr:MAG: HAD family hydrolase [Candidatus Pristimantibacillus lignocellulolyticus]